MKLCSLIPLITLLFATHAFAELPSVCATLTASEASLLQKLPQPLSEFLNKNRHRRFLTLVEADQEAFHSALSNSLATGEKLEVELTGITVALRVKRISPESISITIPYIQRGDLAIGTTVKSVVHNARNKSQASRNRILAKLSQSDYSFPKVMLSTFSWLAENSKTIGAKEIQFVGDNLENKALIETLLKFGFQKGKASTKYCGPVIFVTTMIGAVLGLAGSLAYMAYEDVDKIDLSTELAVIAAGGSVGAPVGIFLGCRGHNNGTGFDYTLTVKLLD